MKGPGDIGDAALIETVANVAVHSLDWLRIGLVSEIANAKPT